MKKSKLLLMSYAGLAATLVLSACGPKKPKADTFTYRVYATALASNWNPHSWETNADSGVLGYLSEGFVSLAPKDTKNGVYQWVYDMATSITDVTRTSPQSLVKYLGLSADDADEFVDGLSDEDPGRLVYQIKLRPGLVWEDGTPINADSFIKSGELMLDPAMKNYRANLYISGESAIAGGLEYYNQGSRVFLDNYLVGLVGSEEDLVLKNGVFVQKTGDFGVYIALNEGLNYLDGYSLKDYVDSYGEAVFDMDVWAELLTKVKTGNEEDAFRLTLTEENLALFKSFLDNSTEWGETGDYWVSYAFVEKEFGAKTFDQVGLEKVDDLTFNYVMANPIDESQAFVSFSSTWLVHEAKYNQFKDTTGSLVTTKYGTKVDNTVSYGPYKLSSLQTDKQMVLVRNEKWHGYTKVDGVITSTTDFEVDGKKVKQYQADTVIIDKLTDEAAKQKFLSGELSEYAPTASELSDYTLSDALYQVDETYTMSLFFNTNLDALKGMDKNEQNQNSVVLSNKSFRKAFSLSIDRAELVTKTAAYKPAYSLMNNLYYYDVWNDPTSSYRRSEPAMQAITNLYGVEYGEDKAYKTLEEAYSSITGYNLTEAKLLMKEAHDALVADGIYVSGQPIKIRVAFKKGALESDDQAQIALLNKYINNAVQGSGFGAVTLEGVGGIEDRYAAVPAGKFAIGYGAWGGAAFYPFRNMQVYTDPDQYDINEAANWDPKTESLTITFEHDGETFTDKMTWQAWGNALTGSGKYALESNEFKLKVTAFMEEKFLDMYFRIPLAGSTASFLLSFQVSYITEEYNIMYDFGGFRLMEFNYSDAAWANFIKQNGGRIDYK